MPAWLEMVLINSVTATLLALLVAALAPRIRRPAIVHLLWLLVLVELVAPPVFELGVLPARLPGRETATSVDAAMSMSRRDPEAPAHGFIGVPSGDASTPATPPAEENRGELLSPGNTWNVLLLLLAAGTLTLLILGARRSLDFHRALRDAVDAGDDLQQRLARLSCSFGLGRPPRLRLVPGRLPPTLWPGRRGHEILVPGGLLQHLEDDEIDALLAHELAHLQRRDHWLRPFELLVLALYWWHPVAWWARRNLRRAEEQSCDAMVVGSFRARPRVYAESLLKTIEYLAIRNPAVPALATGATGTAPLKERVTMILQPDSSRPLPGRLRTGLVAVLALAVLVSPTWVENAASLDPRENPDRTPMDQAQKQHQQQLLEMQRQEVQLQREMQRIEQERMAIQRQIEAKQLQHQLEFMRQELKGLQDEGQERQAQELQRAITSLERESARHREAAEAEQVIVQKRMQIELQLQDLALEMQSAEIAADFEKLQTLQARTLELEQALHRVDLEAMQSELHQQRQRLEDETRQLEEMP